MVSAIHDCVCISTTTPLLSPRRGSLVSLPAHIVCLSSHFLTGKLPQPSYLGSEYMQTPSHALRINAQETKTTGESLDHLHVSFGRFSCCVDTSLDICVRTRQINIEYNTTGAEARMLFPFLYTLTQGSLGHFTSIYFCIEKP